jgi:hypothetical protein
MDTETVIESNLSISVNYNGVSPIGGGRMTFSPNHLTRIAPTNDNTFVKRIVFADLVTSGGYKYFSMVYQSGLITKNYTLVNLTNPAGENIAFSDQGRFLYVKSNLRTYSTPASVPLPSYVAANGAFLLDSTWDLTNPPDGDPILEIYWATSDITAIGNANFYCDLIFSVS